MYNEKLFVLDVEYMYCWIKFYIGFGWYDCFDNITCESIINISVIKWMKFELRFAYETTIL